MDDELTRLLAEGKSARARQLMRERGQSPGRGASPLMALALLALLVGTAALVIYGMSFLGLRVLEALQPTLDPIVRWLAPSVLSTTGLGVLGLLTLAVGLPRAKRFRRPARYRSGVIALASAFGTFWPLQFLVARLELPFPEWRVALHFAGGFVSICLLTGGVEAIRMANNTSEAVPGSS